MQRVLIVDDEPNIRRMVGALLSAEGYDVREAADGAAGVRAVEEEEPDVALIDLMMPGGMDGIATLARIRERWSDLPVIMMSGRASLSDAVRATKVGAVNFLEKPLAPETVLLALSSALELRQARRAARVLRAELGRTGEMVGSSATMVRVRELTARVALSDARVLISGESGTGKELVAAAIHEHSPRRDRPFVRVNCAAIPRDLVESEMFGHEKGSFTGAAERRIGKFELADTGTLFLDEIGDLSMEAQAKLLRAIEAKEIQRVGGNKTIRVDVRIIAATNHDLAQAVADGEFREDLYFRLNVIPIHLPPLRDRGNDVIELLHHFSEIQHQRTGRAALTWTADAEARVRSYGWPGNVRELANIVERLAILSNDSRVSMGDMAAVLPAPRDAASVSSSGVSEDRSLTDTLDDLERKMISDALAWASGNVAEAARRLQTDRANLYRRMKRLGMTAVAIVLCVLSALAASPRTGMAQATTARVDTTPPHDTIPAYDSVETPERPYVHFGPSISSGKTYDRVEGLSILFGPAVTVESKDFALEGSAYLIARTARNFSTSEPAGGHDARLAMRFGPEKAFGLDGRLYDVVTPIEGWQLTEPEQGLATFLLHRDYRDYYAKHGGRIGASWTLNQKASFAAGYALERWSSVDQQDPFTLFREGSHWRPNPTVDEGVFHLFDLSATFDTRNDEREPSGGWYLNGTYEHGASTSAILAPRIQRPQASATSGEPQAVDYGRVFFDLRRYNRVSPRTQLDGRIVAAGWVSGDELPLERKLSVTGPGVLPGYEFRETIGGAADVMQCTAPGVIATNNPVMCDRIVFGQAELRTQLASHPFDFFNIPALRLRSVGFTASPVGVVFVDVGRGWRTTTPWPAAYKSDVGVGLDLGLIGAYVAKAITDTNEPLRFFVRIRRRF